MRLLINNGSTDISDYQCSTDISDYQWDPMDIFPILSSLYFFVEYDNLFNQTPESF